MATGICPVGILSDRGVQEGFPRRSEMGKGGVVGPGSRIGFITTVGEEWPGSDEDGDCPVTEDIDIRVRIGL